MHDAVYPFDGWILVIFVELDESDLFFHDFCQGGGIPTCFHHVLVVYNCETAKRLVCFVNDIFESRLEHQTVTTMFLHNAGEWKMSWLGQKVLYQPNRDDSTLSGG